MYLEELTLLTVYADARIEPNVVSGTEIILIQDGEVSVGKIFYQKNHDPEVYIDHPENENDLIKRAAELVKKKNSKLLEENDAVILTCPKEIIKLMIW
ncbi:MAG: hypothetical protein JSU01_13660 [Bacteroidetes bacterium]|nr:hypothetical protein [Bacteroidota bacterium]